MRFRILLVAALCITAAPASAELSGMELQRCIWQCLASSTGNQDPAYHACVVERCDDGSWSRRPAAGAGGRWQEAGYTEVGQGPTAWVAGTSGSIATLGVFCGRGGPVVYLGDPAADLRLPTRARLSVDGRSFGLRLEHEFVSAVLGRGRTELLDALMAGSVAEVRVAGVSDRFSLSGSRNAITRALNDCL